MTGIVRRSARALLLDGDELVLIKRTRPGREPYWVTVGGGVEDEDASLEDALRREVFEELGGTVDRAELVHLVTDELDDGLGVQHIFAARLETMDQSARTGTEFSRPERGGYEVVRIPFTAEAIRATELMPPPLAEFAANNTEAIRSVLDRPVRAA
ncbi:NUDIX domain-containing protein [Streptomyces sp. ST2-7A]|uniref:NUDIX hydrolase n=1 Tax=Streptomyces sp. ST2-7A TaxID=2907214 RepID=UPI001F39D2B3|nr:NUDIX hydrolase [Streptomyces sp. ST2-7A]MCE7082819.1 NUDIX hydrolase [Streptomyces sp. ST2-7A]